MQGTESAQAKSDIQMDRKHSVSQQVGHMGWGEVENRSEGQDKALIVILSRNLAFPPKKLQVLKVHEF